MKLKSILYFSEFFNKTKFRILFSIRSIKTYKKTFHQVTFLYPSMHKLHKIAREDLQLLNPIEEIGIWDSEWISLDSTTRGMECDSWIYFLIDKRTKEQVNIGTIRSEAGAAPGKHFKFFYYLLFFNLNK
jgi:hypothetical protein